MLRLNYVRGANFLRALEQMENGDALVESAMKSAPGDVLSLFDTQRYLDPKIHASSKQLAALLASEQTQWLSSWVNIPKAVFTQSSFPRSSQRRATFVKARAENLLGSAMSNYYAPDSSDLLPISIKLLQARSLEPRIRS